MDNQILNEVQQIRSIVSNGAKDTGERLARLETLLTPTIGQPSRLDEFDDRISSLESARNWVLGAWGAITAIFGIHVYTHKG